MQTTAVACDCCGRDLSTTGNSEDYRLLLKSERIPSWDGVVTDMHIEPPVERDTRFCGIICLAKWLTREAFSGEVAE